MTIEQKKIKEIRKYIKWLLSADDATLFRSIVTIELITKAKID